MKTRLQAFVIIPSHEGMRLIDGVPHPSETAIMRIKAAAKLVESLLQEGYQIWVLTVGGARDKGLSEATVDLLYFQSNFEELYKKVSKQALAVGNSTAENMPLAADFIADKSTSQYMQRIGIVGHPQHMYYVKTILERRFMQSEKAFGFSFVSAVSGEKQPYSDRLNALLLRAHKADPFWEGKTFLTLVLRAYTRWKRRRPPKAAPIAKR